MADFPNVLFGDDSSLSLLLVCLRLLFRRKETGAKKQSSVHDGSSIAASFFFFGIPNCHVGAFILLCTSARVRWKLRSFFFFLDVPSVKACHVTTERAWQCARLTAEKKKRESQGACSMSEAYSVLLCCSDFRVQPERWLARMLGSAHHVFMLRTIGHVLDEATLENLNFLLQQFSIQHVFILGHLGCKAVRHVTDGALQSRLDTCFSRFPIMTQIILPSSLHAIETCAPHHPHRDSPDDALSRRAVEPLSNDHAATHDHAVREHALNTARQVLRRTSATPRQVQVFLVRHERS